MARNSVQFQKGYSLGKFLAEYGTEHKCESALFRWRWPQGFVCPECGYRGHCTLGTRRLYQCHRCRHQTSLTAGTLFAHTKLALTMWFLAMYLVTQTKNGISALALGRQLGVSYNTAWAMKHKLMQAMKERDDARPLGGIVQLDDAYWGGRRRGAAKKGRGTPGKTPFLAAVATTETYQPVAMRLSRVNAFNYQEVERWACKHLEPDAAVVSDGMRCLGGVQCVGATHLAYITHFGHHIREIPALAAVNTMLGNIKRAIHGTYHSVSPKHLPRYLAEFSYRFNRRFNLAQMLPRLGYVATRTPPMPLRLLKLAEAHW